MASGGERPISVSLKDLEAKASVLALCQPLLSQWLSDWERQLSTRSGHHREQITLRR
jgi:hypothetical protein